MLVLSRNVGQKVHIGFDVVVTVLGIQRNRARLGIEGPPTVPIHRNEVFERIQESKDSYDPCSTDSFQDEDCHM